VTAELDRIRSLHAAIEGAHLDVYPDPEEIFVLRVYTTHKDALAEFFAAAPSTVTHLLAIIDAQRAVLDKVSDLVKDLTDPDDCSFDHHGGCQAHGYLSLQPGELCPQLEAKAFLHNKETRNDGQ
jgi:hypothetical protein